MPKKPNSEETTSPPRKNSEETDFIREEEKTYNPHRPLRSSYWIRQSKHPKAADLAEIFKLTSTTT